MQSEDPRAFHGHDFFILSAQPDGRFVLIGIHQRIVTDAFERYGRTADRDDPATRRAVARWLYTSPTMRASLARPGPPYAFEAVVSDAGMLHSLTAFYYWGQVATGFTDVTVAGVPVWRTVTADVVSEVPGLGPVRGRLRLHFFNHCLNC